MNRYVRCLSTSRPALVDFSSIYSKLSLWRRKTPTKKVVDPTTNDKGNVDESSTNSVPRKLRVLGAPPKAEDEWPEIKDFAEFVPWPINHYKRDLSVSDIDAALSTFKKDFTDLEARLELIKQLTSTLNIAVPDPVMNSARTVEDLRAYLIDHSRAYDEKQPDAIYLDPKDFLGTNITIEDPVVGKRERKKLQRELVEKAKKAQKEHMEKLLN